jgi:hypothetical protein
VDAFIIPWFQVQLCRERIGCVLKCEALHKANLSRPFNGIPCYEWEFSNGCIGLKITMCGENATLGEEASQVQDRQT